MQGTSLGCRYQEIKTRAPSLRFTEVNENLRIWVDCSILWIMREESDRSFQDTWQEFGSEASILYS